MSDKALPPAFSDRLAEWAEANPEVVKGERIRVEIQPGLGKNTTLGEFGLPE